MSEIAISVSEAARDFLKVLALVEEKHEPAVLVRDGRAVATINPLPVLAGTCSELADLWPKLDRLSDEEAAAFADDVESARAKVPAVKPAWD